MTQKERLWAELYEIRKQMDALTGIPSAMSETMTEGDKKYFTKDRLKELIVEASYELRLHQKNAEVERYWRAHPEERAEIEKKISDLQKRADDVRTREAQQVQAKVNPLGFEISDNYPLTDTSVAFELHFIGGGSFDTVDIFFRERLCRDMTTERILEYSVGSIGSFEYNSTRAKFLIALGVLMQTELLSDVKSSLRSILIDHIKEMDEMRKESHRLVKILETKIA